MLKKQIEKTPLKNEKHYEKMKQLRNLQSFFP